MKVYSNRALLYKEWRIVKWIILAMTIIMCYFQFTDINGFINIAKRINPSQSTGYQSMYNFMVEGLFNFNGTTVIIIFMLIGAAYLIIGTDRNKNHEKLMSMPFSKDEMVLTKLYMAVLVIVIPVIVSSALSLIIYYSNFEIVYEYIPLSMMVQRFLLNFLTYLTILLFLMFIHTLCGKGIEASVIGGILLVVPVALPEMLRDIYVVNIRHFERTSYDMFFYNNIKYFDITSYNQANHPHFDYFSLMYFVLIVLSVILIWGIYFSFVKGRTERIGNLLMFNSLEKVLKIGVGICGGLLISALAISSTSYVSGASYVAIIDLIFILGFALCYFILNKIIESNKV